MNSPVSSSGTQPHLYLCYAACDKVHALSIFSALSEDGYRITAAIYPDSPPCASDLYACEGLIVLLSPALIEDPACCRLCAAAASAYIPMVLAPLTGALLPTDLPFALHMVTRLPSCDPSAVCDGVRRCKPLNRCRSERSDASANLNPVEPIYHSPTTPDTQQFSYDSPLRRRQTSESGYSSNVDHYHSSDENAFSSYEDDDSPRIINANGYTISSAPAATCSHCGSSLKPGTRFCFCCGHAVDGKPFPPVSASAPVAAPCVPAPSAPSCPSVTTLASKPAEARLDQVHFSALAPKTLAKGDYSMIDVVMYEGSSRHIVEQMLSERDEPTQEARSGLMQVAEQTRVRVELSSPELPLEGACEEGVWVGEYLSFSFPVLLPEDYPKKQIPFTAAVYFNDVIATRLNFIVKCRTLFGQKIQIIRDDVLSAFVSYSSADRARVATLIQGMRAARPDLNVFFDVDSLRVGEQWEDTLYREIAERDVLYLCWSKHARNSVWVDREWRYALRTKGLQGIEPLPLESAQDCPPPEELSSKHFNEALLHYIGS